NTNRAASVATSASQPELPPDGGGAGGTGGVGGVSKEEVPSSRRDQNPGAAGHLAKDLASGAGAAQVQDRHFCSASSWLPPYMKKAPQPGLGWATRQAPRRASPRMTRSARLSIRRGATVM